MLMVAALCWLKGPHQLVDAGKILVHLFRDGDDPSEGPCSPCDLGRPFDQGHDVEHLGRAGPTATKPWLANRAAPRSRNAATAFSPTSAEPDMA